MDEDLQCPAGRENAFYDYCKYNLRTIKIFFDVVNVVLVQINLYHLHISLINGLSIIFLGICM